MRVFFSSSPLSSPLSLSLSPSPPSPPHAFQKKKNAHVLLHLRHLLRVGPPSGPRALAHRLHEAPLALAADDRRPHAHVLADQLGDLIRVAPRALRDAPDAGGLVEGLGVGGVELLVFWVFF